MALRPKTIGGSQTGPLFIGEDRTIRIHVKDGDGASVDITGWVGSFVVRVNDADADPPVLSVALSVSGTYAATNNPQRWVATLTDTLTAALSAISYRYSAKRTDDGSETVVAYGPFAVTRATQV